MVVSPFGFSIARLLIQAFLALLLLLFLLLLLLLLLALHSREPFICIIAAEAAGDVDSLLRLKSWTRDSWGALSTWSPSAAPRFCSWPGVSCTPDNRNVAAISLPGKRLIFTLRDGLGSLRRLSYLNLSSNFIDGEIPNDFSQLHSLEVLDLSNNRLRGGIPKGLGNLPNLKVFIISGNNIGGFFPNNLCNAPRLHTIISNNNQLIGPITNDLWNCSMLVTLNVAQNKIDSKFPPRLNRLKSLHSLNFAHNMIRGQIPSELANIAELSEIQLQYNSLYGSIPSGFGRCRFLTIFDVASNRLTGYIPSAFGELILLEHFRVSNNLLQGKIPSELGALTSLKHSLDLSHNRFSGEIPATLGNLNAASLIDLSENLLSGQLPESIGSCYSLKKISVAGNGITGNIPSSWFTLPVLFSLNLSWNKLSGTIAPDVGYTVSLSNLDLSHNLLSGEIPGSLLKLVDLRYLDLSANSLQGVVPNFSRWIRVSVTGNKNLCGWRINVTCPLPKAELPAPVPQYVKLLKLAGENLGIALAVLVFLVVGFPVSTMIYFSLFQREKFKAITDATKSFLGSICCCDLKTCCYSHQENTIELVRAATNNFSENNIVGIGQNYAIYSTLWPEGSANKKKSVVVKRLCQVHQAQIPFLVQQAKVLSHVKHPNIVRILNWCSDSNEFCILLGTRTNANLGYYLYNSDMAFYLGWEQCLKIALSVANGLAYLHSKWWKKTIIHCNLQPSNILLYESFEAQLSDLRYCVRSNLKEFLLEESESCYISPECLNGEPLSKASEVYGFGVFILALLTRYMPETCSSTLGMPLERWVKEAYPVLVVDYVVLQTAPTEDHVRRVVELALSCTLESPTLRLTMPQVKEKLEELKIG